MTAEAARNTVKWPFRWVSMTASHSSSDMLNSIRSRRMPATATTPSIRPHRSMPAPMIRSPPARVVTLSATATASPPAALISATTASATSLFGSSPAIDTPMSATTTLAPSAAAARATARPMPPPAPVMATTLPSRNAVIACLLLFSSISRGPPAAPSRTPGDAHRATGPPGG